MLLLLLLLGSIAQLVDGTLGMGYGVTASGLLLWAGVAPIVISASVHTAEIFTSLISGISHWSFGNVKKDLLWKMLLPGVVGGVIGAVFLSTLSTAWARPWVATVLSAMGILMIIRFLFQKRFVGGNLRYVWATTLIGGFLDATGGGGWGPVVTPALVLGGLEPREAVGTVSLVEFAVTVAEVATFAFMVGAEAFDVGIVIPMLVGGVIAAPIAAKLCGVIPSRILGVGIGLFLFVLNFRILI